ncbi:MmcB family DNA repair protein [Rubrimonas sp.]|uniref:MmcB family DNA repair protein n=1 Tax=Rubrimonas sp. TaxID=2036015 RepID=UPI002FDDD3B6
MTLPPDRPGPALARGVCRMLLAQGAAPLTEFAPAPGLRVDVLALARDGAVIAVECKSCLADFRADAKWRGYLDWCDAFYFAVDASFPVEFLPPDEGVMIADAWGGEILRPAAPRRLAAARRRALALRVARTAAERLLRVLDPQAGPG